MKRLLLSFTLFLSITLFLFRVQVYAGVTGKIAGKVTDAETREELIGINVLIEGTTLGAATNIDGSFIL